MRPHRAVDSFEELARQVAEPSTAASEPWNKAPLLQKLQGLLVGDAFSLIVVEAAEHIDLAEAMFKQAKNTNVELDVGTLEELWGKADGENKDPNRTRMEEAGSRGRFLSLVRHYDLAAIMPDRIAGKLRRNYLQAYPSVSSSDAGTTEFSNHYVTLKMASEVFQVGNLIFQDQAAGMKKMVTFLICLLDTPYTREERFRVFTEGLAEMGIPFEDLQQMDFNQAFQYLLQGFSLPPGLRVGERNFVRGVSGGDSEALNFLQGLQVYLDTAVLDASADCDVVLIPDPAASTLWEGEELQVVSSIPTATSKISVGSPEFQGLQKEVQVAKTAAREALKDAIYARGAKNTRRKIVNGHERLDRGNALLARATDDKGLHEAIKAFKKAAKIFEEAKKLSIELENDVPSMPVF